MDNPTSTSTCPGCSEDIVTEGALHFRIVPPPKGRRLAKTEPRSRKQLCEITCTHCHTVTKYQFAKPAKSDLSATLATPSSESFPSSTTTPSIQELRRERKRKPPKDANAGLIIPSSFTPSPFSMKRPGQHQQSYQHHRHQQQPKPKPAAKKPDLSFLSAALAKSSSSSGSSLDRFLK